METLPSKKRLILLEPILHYLILFSSQASYLFLETSEFDIQIDKFISITKFYSMTQVQSLLHLYRSRMYAVCKSISLYLEWKIHILVERHMTSWVTKPKISVNL